MKMLKIDEDLRHRSRIDRNGGGTKEPPEGLPGTFEAFLCGSSPPSLDEIKGLIREKLEAPAPAEIRQTKTSVAPALEGGGQSRGRLPGPERTGGEKPRER